MLTLLAQIQEIKTATSKKEKARLLRKHDSPALRQLLFIAYSPTVVLGVGEPHYDTLDRPELYMITLAWFLSFVRQVQAREVKGMTVRFGAEELLRHTPVHFRWILAGILEGNLDLGCDVKLINAALPNLVPTLDMQLPEDLKPEHLEFPGYASPLVDGMRCLAVVTRNGVRLFSSRGNAIESVPHIDAAMKKLMPGFYDGKLVHPSGFSTAIHYCRAKTPKVGHDGVVFLIADFIPEHEWNEPTTPAKDRFKKLDAMFMTLEANALERVEHTLIHRKTDLQRLFKEFTSQGFVGITFQSPGAYVRRRGRHLQTLRGQPFGE